MSSPSIFSTKKFQVPLIVLSFLSSAILFTNCSDSGFQALGNNGSTGASSNGGDAAAGIVPGGGTGDASMIIPTTPYAGGPLAVIPGLVGYGVTETVAGRGGAIMRVTNLNDSGAGSLRACVAASEPRVCVFEISGTIVLNSRLDILNPFITIAGQTAPTPGIILRGDGLLVWNTHDALIQHLQIRPGDGTAPSNTVCGQRSAIGVAAENGKSAYNIVYDHISAGWATDQTVGIWGQNATNAKIYNVTLSNSIFSEALNNSCHDKGAHPMGPLIGDGASKVTVVNNILAQQIYRNPLLNTGMTDGIVVNNFIRYSIAGNAMISRPGDNTAQPITVPTNGPATAKIYAKDNSFNGVSTNFDGVGSYGTVTASMNAASPPIWNTGMTAMASSMVEAYTSKNAGTRPASRDPIDARVLIYIKNRGGVDIDSPNDVGGYPSYAVNTRTFAAPANPNADDNKNGYTNLEEVLQQMAATVEGR